MPIYEYRCQDCGRVTSFFVRAIGVEVAAVCAHCGGGAMARRMSAFATGKTAASVHEQFAPGSEHRSPDYYRDPRNIGRNVEAAFQKYGMAMPPAVRDNIDAARQGESPKGLDL